MRGAAAAPEARARSAAWQPHGSRMAAAASGQLGRAGHTPTARPGFRVPRRRCKLELTPHRPDLPQAECAASSQRCSRLTPRRLGLVTALPVTRTPVPHFPSWHRLGLATAHPRLAAYTFWSPHHNPRRLDLLIAYPRYSANFTDDETFAAVNQRQTPTQDVAYSVWGARPGRRSEPASQLPGRQLPGKPAAWATCMASPCLAGAVLALRCQARSQAAACGKPAPPWQPAVATRTRACPQPSGRKSPRPPLAAQPAPDQSAHFARCSRLATIAPPP